MPKSYQARRSESGYSAVKSPTTDILINKPGVFLSIPLSQLKIDTEYQRPLSGNRVDKMSSNWSWVACGCLTVALRGPGSGDYFIVDGQHRMESAQRAGIFELPCLVFETLTHIEEAKGFLDVNIARKAMSVLDRYRALLVVEDPVALKARDLLEKINRTPMMGGAKVMTNAGNSITCLEFLMNAISTDCDTLEKIWPLINDLCEGRLITKKLLQGFFYLERFLTNTSILERHWYRRIMQVGYDSMSKSIDETTAFEGKGGSAICAQGILRALNKGLRNKLKIEVETTAPEKED